MYCTIQRLLAALMEEAGWRFWRRDIIILYDTVYLQHIYTQYLMTHSSGTKVEMTKSSLRLLQYAKENLRLAKIRTCA